MKCATLNCVRSLFIILANFSTVTPA